MAVMCFMKPGQNSLVRIKFDVLPIGGRPPAFVERQPNLGQATTVAREALR